MTWRAVDPIAFEAWYAAEHPRLVSTLAVATGDIGLAREAADEAFARAYERWDRVSTMDAPGGWTYRTACNVLRRRWRRSALERRHTRRGETVAAPAAWSAEVWDAVRRLPERERTAIALRYVADLTTEEIAAAMRVAPGTVGSTLHAARRNLARALSGTDDASVSPSEESADA